MFEVKECSCLDAAYERQAMEQGMVKNPVFPENQDINVTRVQEKMEKRSQVGYNKYGVTTERTDLSMKAWITHLQEELMDAAIYCEVLLKRIG